MDTSLSDFPQSKNANPTFLFGKLSGSIQFVSGDRPAIWSLSNTSPTTSELRTPLSRLSAARTKGRAYSFGSDSHPPKGSSFDSKAVRTSSSVADARRIGAGAEASELRRVSEGREAA